MFLDVADTAEMVYFGRPEKGGFARPEREMIYTAVLAEKEEITEKFLESKRLRLSAATAVMCAACLMALVARNYELLCVGVAVTPDTPATTLGIVCVAWSAAMCPFFSGLVMKKGPRYPAK